MPCRRRALPILLGLLLATLAPASPAEAGGRWSRALASWRAKIHKPTGWLKRLVPPGLRPRAPIKPGRCEVIPIGSDHAGFQLKEHLKAQLIRRGYRPLDLGTYSVESVDYPDFAHKVAGKVSSGAAKRGILVCGTGIGMSMAANRHPGVRAAVVWSPEIAETTRRHNDANVLALPARHLDQKSATEILDRFLNTPFDGGRHLRRINKIEPPAYR